MNKYDMKVTRLQEHLKTNPADYQSVVSLFIAQSDAIAYEQKRQFDIQKKCIHERMRKGQNGK